MSAEQGIVVRLKDNGLADVMTEKGGGCESCSASHSCHTFGTGNKMITRAQPYYFCNSGCKQTFSRDPKKYI
ncbi:MAG: hypothetical protein WAL98_02625 [Desulfatiglandaceae bacterium]